MLIAQLAAALAALLCAWVVLAVVVPLRRALEVQAQLTKTGIPTPADGAGGLSGHIAVLARTPGQSYREVLRWTQEFGPIFQIRLLFTTIVVVTDPALFGRTMVGPDRLPKHKALYRGLEMMTNPAHRNLVTNDQEDAYWKSVRKAIAPAFNMATLKLSFPAIRSVTERLLSHLHQLPEGRPIDMDVTLQRLTCDVIGIVGFSKDYEATDLSTEPPVLKALQHLLEAVQARNNPFNRWFFWRKPYRQFHYWRKRMDEHAEALARHVRSVDQPAHTLGGHLVRCINQETGQPLTHTQLKSELAILWGAGFETSSHAATWALMCIATHPEVEARLVEELRGLGLLATPDCPEPRQLQWEDLSQLKYLSAVLSESMRLFPSVSPGTTRYTDRPYQLGPYKLPQGVVIWPPFYSIHRSAANWSDPDSFQPGRWLEGGEAAGAALDAPARGQASPPASRSSSSALNGGADGVDRSPSSMSSPERSAASFSGKVLRPFLPFSEGPRACVGQSLALVEIRAALVLLLGHFSFQLTPDMGGWEGVSASATQAITLRPKNGLWAFVRPRKLG